VRYFTGSKFWADGGKQNWVHDSFSIYLSVRKSVIPYFQKSNSFCLELSWRTCYIIWGSPVMASRLQHKQHIHNKWSGPDYLILQGWIWRSMDGSQWWLSLRLVILWFPKAVNSYHKQILFYETDFIIIFLLLQPVPSMWATSWQGNVWRKLMLQIAPPRWTIAVVLAAANTLIHLK